MPLHRKWMILKRPERESSKMNKHPVKFSLEKQNSQMSLAETASLHLVQCPLTKLGTADPSTGSCRATSGISHSTTLCHKHSSQILEQLVLLVILTYPRKPLFCSCFHRIYTCCFRKSMVYYICSVRHIHVNSCLTKLYKYWRRQGLLHNICFSQGSS